MKHKLAILLLFFSLSTYGQDWSIIPQPVGWVNDFENIYSDREEKVLDSIVNAFELETSIEISVITIPASATTKEEFDALNLRIANTWGVGKKEKDNGILIGISKEHRMIRISNGYGIESLLSDSRTKQIIDEVFIPYFKSNKYYEGTLKGILEIIISLERAQSGFIDLKEVTVYEYIERLKIGKGKGDTIPPLVIMEKAPDNWVTEKDIDSLITYIDNNDSVECVMMIYSSIMPFRHHATLGGHVMDIIDAYREKKDYPLSLTSCPITSEERIKEIRRWWQSTHRK